MNRISLILSCLLLFCNMAWCQVSNQLQKNDAAVFQVKHTTDEGKSILWKVRLKVLSAEAAKMKVEFSTYDYETPITGNAQLQNLTQEQIAAILEQVKMMSHAVINYQDGKPVGVENMAEIRVAVPNLMNEVLSAEAKKKGESQIIVEQMKPLTDMLVGMIQKAITEKSVITQYQDFLQTFYLKDTGKQIVENESGIEKTTIVEPTAANGEYSFRQLANTKLDKAKLKALTEKKAAAGQEGSIEQLSDAIGEALSAIIDSVDAVTINVQKSGMLAKNGIVNRLTIVSATEISVMGETVTGSEQTEIIRTDQSDNMMVADVLGGIPIIVKNQLESTGYTVVDRYVSMLLFGDETDSLSVSFSRFRKLWNVRYDNVTDEHLPSMSFMLKKVCEPDGRFICYYLKSNFYIADHLRGRLNNNTEEGKKQLAQFDMLRKGTDRYFIFDPKNNQIVGLQEIFVPDIAKKLSWHFGLDVSLYAENRCLQLLSAKLEGRFLFIDESEPNFTDYFKQLVGWNELGTIETPAFLHGQQGLNDYFKRVVRLASDAEEADSVMLSVVVQKNGIVSEPKIVKKTGSAPETQLLAACMDMPKWQPAYEEGVPVKKEAFFALRLKRMSQSLAAKQDVTPIEAIPHAGAAGGDGVKVFDVVEQMPEFPGGQAALLKWIGDNIKYPSIAEDNNIQGRVVCTFVVERDGSITDVQVARSIDPSLDKEAVRVLKQMPKWNPGMQKGERVRVKYTVPIMFRLEVQKVKKTPF